MRGIVCVLEPIEHLVYLPVLLLPMLRSLPRLVDSVWTFGKMSFIVAGVLEDLDESPGVRPGVRKAWRDALQSIRALPYVETVLTCSNCDEPWMSNGDALMRCARCHSAWYCSTSCQKMYVQHCAITSWEI